MGWAMVLGRHIFVDRRNHQAALASIELAKESLKKYPRSIVIFPEGTRSKDGKIKPFKKGGIVLGIKTNTPLVPMAICHTLTVIKKGTFKIQPHPIQLNIGHPIKTTKFDYEDRNYVTEILHNEVVNLKAIC